MTNFGSGYKMESKESSALRSINTESYDYRDQAKLLTKLTGDVSYLAQYTRQMQQGIDAANQNFIEQIQDFINEILVLIGGGGDTGFDFGDLKYIFQAIGALFGFDTETGLAGIFPINLFSAAWHFFSTYIIPIDNFGEFVDWLIDQFIAMVLDAFGDIPIVGQALEQLFVWITQIRDLIAAFNEMFGSWVKSTVDFIYDTVTWLWETFVDWTEPIATFISSTVTFLWNLFASWTEPLVTWITESLTFLWDLFSEWTEPIVTWIVESLTWLGTLFDGWTTMVVNAISESIDWLTTLFNGWTGDLVGWIISSLESLWETFVDWTEPIATWVISTLEWLWGLFEPWTAPFIAVIEEVVEAVQAIVDWFTGGVGAAISALFPWAQRLPQMDPITNVIPETTIPPLPGDKITTGTVKAARIQELDAGKITTGAFTAAFIQSNAITSDKILDGAVSTAKIGDFAINGQKIDNGAVSGTKLADSAVSNSKIANSAVDANKISNNAVSNAKIANGAVDVNKISDGAVSNPKISDNAVSTSKIDNFAVTSGKVLGIDGSKISDGTIAAARLPSALTTPGSGVVCVKTGGSYTTTYNSSGVQLPWGFYNSVPSNTADLEIFNSGGKTACKATVAGWYEVEVGFQIQGGDDLVKYAYSWNLTPAIWKNGAIYKWGSSANYVCWVDVWPGPHGFGNDFAQSTFIVPMAANDVIIPGYFWSRSNSTASDTIIKPTSTGYGTYFGMSLLNRSLA